MSQLRSLRWQVYRTERAKHIPKRKWNEHKAEICALYENMTLDDVRASMRDRHAFCPSRRQYITQFEHWGIKKYNRNRKNWSDSAIDYGTNLQPSTHVLQTNARDTLQSPDPNSNPRKAVIERWPEGVQPLLSDSSTLLPPKSSPSGSIHRCSDTRRHPIRMAEVSVIADRISPIAGANLCFSLRDPQVLESDKMSDTASTRSREAISTPLSLTGYREMDLSLPAAAMASMYDLQAIQQIRFAADFLFCTFSHEDAFTMYTSLHTTLENPTIYPQYVRTTAFLSYMRSSSTRQQHSFAKEILQVKLRDETDDSVAAYLYHSLAADIEDKAQIDTAQTRLRLRESAADHSLTSRSTLGNETISLLAYRHMYRSTVSSGLDRLAAARALKAELLRLPGGPFEFGINEYMGNDVLRASITWALREIKKPVIALWRTPRGDRVIRQRRTDFTMVFSRLWQRMHEGLTTPALSWTLDVERTMGISPIELIAIDCFMMLEACPPGAASRAAIHSSRLPDDPSLVTDRARKGARFLVELSDIGLAEAFIDAFDSFERFSRMSVEGLTHEDRIFHITMRHSLLSFVQESLQVIFKNLYRAHDADYEGHTYPVRHHEDFELDAVWMRQTLLPALGSSSLHSSDMSSFKNTQRHAEERALDDAMQALSVECPSAMMIERPQNRRSGISFDSFTRQLSSGVMWCEPIWPCA